MATINESYDVIMELCEQLDKLHPESNIQECEICNILDRAEIVLADGGCGAPERNHRCEIWDYAHSTLVPRAIVKHSGR